jgi:hypothetical protein
MNVRVLKNSSTTNIYGYLSAVFDHYRRGLKLRYPGMTIRKAMVIESGIRELSRLGWIHLVDSRLGIPPDVPDFLVRSIKRTKHQPIWIPGPHIPECWDEIFDQLQVSMQGGDLVWHHKPATQPSRW